MNNCCNSHGSSSITGNNSNSIRSCNTNYSSKRNNNNNNNNNDKSNKNKRRMTTATTTFSKPKGMSEQLAPLLLVEKQLADWVFKLTGIRSNDIVPM